MKGFAFDGPQDLFALLVRRKWWVIIPFLILSGLVAVFTKILPKSYVSETLILIRPRDVPSDFVKDMISGSPEERVSAIKQTVLSRTNLVQILREFEVELADFKQLNMDEKVLRIGDQININFEFEKNMGSLGRQLPLTYFRISYQNRDPELAQKIAAKLTSLFIEQDNKAREAQVYGTTEFLQVELDKVKTQLSESENRLKEVKSRKQYELPDQLEPNLRALDRLGLQKQANAEALDRYATIRLNLEHQISETSEFVPKEEQIIVSPNPLVAEYRKKQLDLDQLSARYTPRHPEVQTARSELDKLKAQIPPEDLEPPKAVEPAKAADDGADSKTVQAANNGMMPNPIYRSLAGQLAQVKTEFAIREREKATIEAEIQKFGRRVENTPNTELEISEVVRRNADLKKQHDEMSAKLDSSKLSESLESRQKGQQFLIVDPANYPLSPAKPSKVKVILVGNAIALLIAIAIAVGVDVARQKMWTQSEVQKLWGFPVLVEIPEILTDADIAAAKKRRLGYIATSVVGAVVYSFGLYQMYVRQGTVLELLDPLVQRLIY